VFALSHQFCFDCYHLSSTLTVNSCFCSAISVTLSPFFAEFCWFFSKADLVLIFCFVWIRPVDRKYNMAASTMSQMMVSMNLGGLQALRVQSSSLSKLGDARLATTPRLMTSIAGRVRCQAGDGKGPSPLADVKNYVDQSTKQEITKDDILRNQESNESEKRSVFGAKPNSGSLYPRPELERRPETGSKSFWSVFAFDGAAPETINGRLVSTVFLSGRNFAK